MSSRLALNPKVYIDSESEDAAAGYEIAQSAWFSQRDGKTYHQAVNSLAEDLLAVALTDSTEAFAGTLYGAICLLLETAPKVTAKEVTT